MNKIDIPEITSYLVSRITELLSLEDPIEVNEKLFNHGFNSARATMVALELSEKLEKKISPTIFYAYPTIESLANYLASDGHKKRVASSITNNTGSANEPIAIIGLSCRFPSHEDVKSEESLDAFWELLESGLDAVGEIPNERWDMKEYYDPDANAEGKSQAKNAALIDGINGFDPYFFDISPREAIEMSPDQKICLELAWEALSHAQIKPDDLFGSKTGVFVGNALNDFAHLRIKQHASINQHSAVGQSANIIANRISYTYGFRGPSIVIDTACSSSLYAIHLACQALREGDCNIALAGGVNIILDPEMFVYMSKFGGLSPTGKCHTFDADADGYVRGEGAGMIILKPLSQAIHDKDHIYAVVKGSAVNNDGASNGLTAPNLDAQEEVLNLAYARAGIDPSKVQYIEAHGTGTKLGDPIEAEALSRAMMAGRTSPLRVGSVKTNIGHLEGAAGIASIIKVALAMNKHLIPASLHFNKPNPYIPFKDWNLEVNSQKRPWDVAPGDTRKAGISSFGWGGANAHIVLEEYTNNTLEVFVIAAPDRQILLNKLTALADKAAQHQEDLSLKELCSEYANQATSLPHRVAIKAESFIELQSKLADVIMEKDQTAITHIQADTPLPIVYAVSPFGGQYIGMAVELFENDKFFKEKMLTCDLLFQKIAGWSLVEKLYSLNDDDLEKSGIIAPMIFAIQVSISDQMKAYGISPSVLIGHSAGEIAAAYIAGFFTLEDALMIIHHYGSLGQTVSGPYSMAIVNRPYDLLKEEVKDYPSIEFAAINSESSCNIAGFTTEVDRLIKALHNKGIRSAKINLPVPAHTSHIDKILEELESRLSHIKPVKGKTPMYSTTLEKYLDVEDLQPNYWCKNIRQTVKFAQGMRQLLVEEKLQHFIEISPQPTLKGSINQNISQHKSEGAFVYHAMEKGKADTLSTKNLLKLFYLKGLDIFWNKLYSKYLIKSNTEDLQKEKAYPNVMILPISAKSEKVTREYIQKYEDFLTNKVGNTAKEIYDVCATAALKKTAFEYRVAFSGKTKEEILDEIRDYLSNPYATISGNIIKGKKVAFVFSGQGAQWLGMGRKMIREYDIFRKIIEVCDKAFQRYTSWSLIDQIKASEEESMLDQAFVLQPALFAIQIALARQWISWGIIPHSVVGHSMGEIAAAYIAGAIRLDVAVKIICLRSQSMQRLSGKGAMLAVGMSYDEAMQRCSSFDGVELAVNNSPTSCVIGGEPTAIEALERQLKEEQVFCKKVKMDVASHTFQMDEILEELKLAFNDIEGIGGSYTIYSSVETTKIDGQQLTGDYWVKNVRSKVRFADTMKQMIADNHAMFLEVSPHPILSQAIQECLKHEGKEQKSAVIHSTLRNKSEEREMLKNLEKVFSVGYPVPWNDVYRSSENFVPVPHYPWHREDYVFEDHSEEFGGGQQMLKRNDGSMGHPFLAQYLELANQDDINIWETRINVESIPFLKAHKSGNNYTLPTSVYIEMLEAAIDELYHMADYAGHDLYIHQPVVLKDGYAPVLQLKVERKTEKLSKFEIFVADLKDKSNIKRNWELVADGKITLEDEVVAFPSQPNISSIQNTNESLDKEHFYKHMKTLGFDYDENYQCVEKVWSLGKEQKVVAKIVPTKRIWQEQEKYKLHPILIGSCIRTLVAIMPKEMLQEAHLYEYYGSSIGKMHIINEEEYTTPLWVGCELIHEGQESKKDEYVGNFTLYNNKGRVIARSEHFCLKRRPREQKLENQYLYQTTWKQIESNKATKKHSPEKVLLFAQNNQWGRYLIKTLNDHGYQPVVVVPGYEFSQSQYIGQAEKITINPFKPEDYEMLWSYLLSGQFSPQNMVYAWGLEDNDPALNTSDDFTSDAKVYLMGLIHLFQSISQQKHIDISKINIITSHAQILENEEANNLAASSLWGLARTIRHEFAELPCRTIDLGHNLHKIDGQQLISEIVSPVKEHELLLRNTKKFASRLQVLPQSMLENDEASIKIQEAKTYVITGGLGGLGLAFAQWLVQQKAKHIVLLGRSKPKTDTLAKIKELISKGANVVAMQADVVDINSLSKALTKTRETMPPIGGIFHAAGILDDSSLLKMTKEQVEKVNAPKIKGAWNLHELTLNDPIHAFVLFSSAATILGSVGQGNYVAANAFLDSLAAYRKQQNLPALAVNWGAVKDVGMASSQDNRGSRLDEEGVVGMTAQKYLQFFSKAFQKQIHQVAILDFNYSTWRQHYPSYAKSSYFDDLNTETLIAAPIKKDQTEVWAELGSPELQIQWIENLLKEKTAFVTKANPNKLPINASFKELGIDSLMLVQLRNNLDEQLQLQISVSSFFSYPTIKEYAKYINDKLKDLWQSKGKSSQHQPEQAQLQEEPKQDEGKDLMEMSLEELSQALDDELND